MGENKGEFTGTSRPFNIMCLAICVSISPDVGGTEMEKYREALTKFTKLVYDQEGLEPPATEQGTEC